MLLLAQIAGGLSVGQIAIAVIIIVAIIGVVYVVCQATGVPIPPWVVHILWICIVAFVAVVAIRFLMSL